MPLICWLLCLSLITPKTFFTVNEVLHYGKFVNFNIHKPCIALHLYEWWLKWFEIIKESFVLVIICADDIVWRCGYSNHFVTVYVCMCVSVYVTTIKWKPTVYRWDVEFLQDLCTKKFKIRRFFTVIQKKQRWIVFENTVEKVCVIVLTPCINST